ncbi:AAA family ATPase [Pseudoduganella sp. R-34]|uniref:AAA family ATPase n=1 Tax=Pseudoduganella sp. R-34 TaxID=3404062 RepID=UPI003CECCF89
MAAKIVVVFNQKGGCAKTMTSMQIGGTWGLMGKRVLIVDMDPQNTAKLWELQADPSTPFPAEVVSLAPLGSLFMDRIQSLVDNFDVIIIDCPPAIESQVPWSALLIADFAIIPVIPVMDNVWASKQAEQMVLQARADREKSGLIDPLNAAYLLSVVRKGKVFDVCLDTLVKGTQLPILKSKVGMRNAYPESQLFGCSVGAFGASVATTEINAVAQELAKQIGLTLNVKGQGKK